MNYAPEGAGRNDKIHGDEELIDLEPFLKPALEDVVETIMLFAEYPQPRSGHYRQVLVRRPRQFDLLEYLFDTATTQQIIGPCALQEFFVACITDHGSADDLISTWTQRIKHDLTEHLRDSKIVRERATEMAIEEEENGHV